MMKIKKSFAWIQMIFSVVLLICSIRFYGQIQDIAMKREIQSMIRLTDNYAKIVDHGQDVYEKTYSTIPQHKKTLVEVCSKIDNVEVTCKTLNDMIPEKMFGMKWMKYLKRIPLEMFQPLGEARKSMKETIVILDTVQDPKKYQDIMETFSQTKKNLQDISSSLQRTENKVSTGSWVMLMLLIAMSICFFTNGAMAIVDNKNQTME